MLIDDGALFTNQLFQCFTAVDRKQYDYAELLIWMVLGSLQNKRRELEDKLKFHAEPGTERHSVLSCAIECMRQRESIIIHVQEDLDEHRPW